MLKFFNTQTYPAEENMKIDSQMLSALSPNAVPILRFYEWQKRALSYGYFIKHEEFIDLKLAKEREIDCVRRPTGGGIVFHTSDLTFSFFMPKNYKFFSTDVVKNYQFVNNHILAAVKDFFSWQNLSQEDNISINLLKENVTQQTDAEAQNLISNFCMAKPTKYDLMFNGKKIAGAAQRTTKNGYLHQASIFLAPVEEEILQVALFPTKNLCDNSSFLLQNRKNFSEIKQKLFELLYHHFAKTLL